MRLVLTMTMKDLRRGLADPAGVLLSLGIPIAIVGTMALAFGGGGGAGHPVLNLVLVDLDDTPVSNMITGATQNEQVAEHMMVHRAATREEGLAVLRSTRSSAMVVIPESFMEDLLEGRPAALRLEKNPSQAVMPVVADQGLQAVALYLSAGRRLLGDEATQLAALFEGEGWDEELALAGMISALYDRVVGVDDLLFPPLIEIGTAGYEEGEEEGGGFDFLSWMFPGMIVMALLFVAITQMKDLLTEAKGGTLHRLLASRAGANQVLIAKVLSVATVVAIAHVVLLAFGYLAFGVRWSDLAALAAVSAVLILAVTGFAALIYALARTEQQGDAFGGVLIMLMSLLGGAFVPPQIMPDWLQGFARGTVNHWANEALRGLASGGAFADIAAPLAVLAGMAVIFTLVGVGFLKVRHLRGAV